MTGLKREIFFYLAGSCWGIFGGVLGIVYFEWRYGKEIAALRERVRALVKDRGVWRKVADDRLRERRKEAA